MKFKALLLSLALLPLFARAEPPPGKEVLTSSTFDDVVYTFYTSESVLAQMPKWKQSSPFPPLSPRKAEQIAFAQLKAFSPDKADRMRSAQDITLRWVVQDDWIYLVIFHYTPEGPVAGVGQEDFTIPVYLDGSTITPETLKLSDH